MKSRIQIALLSTALSIAAHFYLTLHYYPVKFGFATERSVCNLNATFDCESVAASAYSALFGIPMAVWGAVFNAILFMLILLTWLEWTENPERLRRWTLALSGASVLASLAMGAISLTMMKTYCIFCIGLYVLSLITFFALAKTLREPFWAPFKADIPVLWSESRGILISIAAIPVLAYLVHAMFMQNIGGDARLARAVNEAVTDWQAAPKQDFVAKPTLTTGPAPESARMTLVEFADFRCSHCKRASYSLHAFVKANPDVRFEFYTFPLDGACNEKIAQASGLSCRLAAAVYCAEKEGKGWELHDLLFDKQDDTIQAASVPELDVILSKHIVPVGLNWESLQRCMGETETMDAVKAQAKQGALVNVPGTPTLFANGRMLNGGQLIPVLQAVHDQSKK